MDKSYMTQKEMEDALRSAGYYYQVRGNCMQRWILGNPEAIISVAPRDGKDCSMLRVSVGTLRDRGDVVPNHRFFDATLIDVLQIEQVCMAIRIKTASLILEVNDNGTVSIV